MTNVNASLQMRQFGDEVWLFTHLDSTIVLCPHMGRWALSISYRDAGAVSAVLHPDREE